MKLLKELNDYSVQSKLFEQKTGKKFEFFYDKYYAKLVFYINKFCGDTKWSEDLAIESFLMALHKIEKFKPEKAQFSTWLFTVAKNHTLQELKKVKTVSMDMSVDEDGTTMKDFLEYEESDDVLMDSVWKKKADVMEKHIQNLKEPFKTVINMRENKDMVYKDIACELGEDIQFEMESIGGKSNMPFEMSKIYSVTDVNGVEVNYTPIEGDPKKTPFYTQIELSYGKFIIYGRNPKPLSTIKSQIRNGRIALIKETKREFKEIEKMYL